MNRYSKTTHALVKQLTGRTGLSTDLIEMCGEKNSYILVSMERWNLSGGGGGGHIV